VNNKEKVDHYFLEKESEWGGEKRKSENHHIEISEERKKNVT
jgi:hypothetical protein